MKKKENLIVANFKMTLNMSFEVSKWMSTFESATQGLELKDSEFVLCPQIALLDRFVKEVSHEHVEFGAQTCFWEQKGAFTGESSPTMIKSLGGKYVILGHSERRMYFGENNEVINHKIKAALKVGLTPILCIGESGEEKKTDKTLEAIGKQFEECLDGITATKMEKLILCYEPIWAISANEPDHLPTTNEIMEARLLIKKMVLKKFGESLAKKMQILYGGSVKGDNAQEVCADAGMNGALIGGASLLPYDLVKIARILDNKN